MQDQKLDEKAIFTAALALESSAARQEYLQSACDEDSELFQRVTKLLELQAEQPSFLETPAAGILATLAKSPPSERVGTTIGRYKLRELLGEGGMGSVYVAEQTEPVRRKVALKIIKPGMDSREVISRFGAERQALALMDHPNIAKVLDAGTTDKGLPFFVMELVKGETITEHCDLQKLAIRERLELFLQVCHAVQHAHQKGIIHRDLKPSNVIVAMHDTVPVVKVIDFGVAKAIGQQLTDNTLYTAFSQLVGTPLYMSPEQAGHSSLDVDTRSDIYSLGVLLYELLTGTTPFDRERLKEVGVDEMRRIIREVDPPRPSARVSTLKAADQSTIAQLHRVEPEKFSRSLRGELDWIAMKAIEKERNRRYDTVNGLAMDVQRYLSDEPVQACPPSFGYRFRKFTRRYRTPLVTATAIATVLVCATIVSGSLAAWALSEKSNAATHLVVAQRERGDALDARVLAEQQEQLAKQQMQLAKQQRDAADYDAYVANIQLAYSRWMRGSSLFKSLDAVIPQLGRPDVRGWEWYFLHSQVHNELFSFPLQRGAIAWSPSGNKLATVDQAGLVNIWDIRTGLYVKSLAGCPGNIRSLAWSPSGKYLAAGSDHKVVVLWEVDSGVMLRTLRDAAPTNVVDWNPDSIRLASAAEDGSVCIWDVHTGERLSLLILNAGPVKSLDWHSEGNLLLASGGRSGSNDLKVWNTATAVEVSHLTRSYNNNSASFSPDGKRFVFGFAPFRVFDSETQEVVSSFGEPGLQESSWSANGRWMASAIFNDVIRIWDAESGAITGSIQRSDAAGAPAVWSPVGSLLASSSNGSVKVWDTAALDNNPATLSTQGKAAFSVAFSPDGRRLLTGAEFGLHNLWDVESGEEVFSVQSGLPRNRSVTFSPDGRKFAAIGPVAGAIVVRDAATGKSLVELPESKDAVRALAWSPEGNVLAVGYRGIQFKAHYGRVELFDIHSGLSVAASGKARGECNTLAWNHDGSRLAMSGASIRIFDRSLRLEATVAVGSSSLDWRPDGKQLATSGPDGTTTIYDTAAWTPIHDVDGNDAFVNSIDWHPHMPRIATVSADGTARIFETLTGRELCFLDAHASPAQSVAWSPDGLRLATAGDDAIVRIWDGSSADAYLKRHGDLREMAWDYVKTEKFQLALDALEQLRQLHPQEDELVRQSHTVRWQWGAKLAVDGQFAEATAIFDQLQAESAVVPDYRLQVPARIFAAGKQDAAIAMAEEFATEFPDTLEYRDELGFLYESRVTQLFQAGQFAEGTVILRKLADEFHDRPDFRGQLAFEMARTGQVAETITILDKLAEAFDDRPDYRPALAARLGKADEHEMAVTIYEQLLADHPDAQEYQLLRDIESAHLLITAGKQEEAISVLSDIEQRDPSAPVGLLLGQTHLALAQKLLAQGEFNTAISELLEAFKRLDDSNRSVAGYYLALTQLAGSRIEEYRITCAQMSEQFADSKAPQEAHWLAWSCALAPAAVADYSSPMAAAEVALASDSQSVQLLTGFGAILYRAGQYDKAITYLTQASELSGAGSDAGLSSPAYTYYFLAMACHAMHRVDDALQWQFQADALAAAELATVSTAWNRKLTLQLLRAEAAELLGLQVESKSEKIESLPK